MTAATEGRTDGAEAIDGRGAQAQVGGLSRAVGELAGRVAPAIRSCRTTSEPSGGAPTRPPLAHGTGTLLDASTSSVLQAVFVR